MQEFKDPILSVSSEGSSTLYGMVKEYVEKTMLENLKNLHVCCRHAARTQCFRANGEEKVKETAVLPVPPKPLTQILTLGGMIIS